MTPTPEECRHRELKWNITAQTSVMAIQTTVWGVECVGCGRKWDVGQVMQAVVDLSASQERVLELERPRRGYTKGVRDDARRRALNILNGWIDVTGALQREASYYYELQAVIEDAVECGAQAALGIREPLEAERGPESPP